MTNKRLGWKPDLPDHRDHTYLQTVAPVNIPPSIDLRPGFPAPYNQLNLGSCTANAIAGAVEYDLIRQKLPIFMPSRLFVYYNERVIESSVSEDSGATLRDGIKTLNTWGVCSEKEWPYIETKFAVKPTGQCYTDALKCKAVSYATFSNRLTTMKSCLAAGNPFVYGFSVYDSFETDAVAATGIVPMPLSGEDMLGGHAVVACGYNDTTAVWNGIPPRHMLCRNSWGPFWGASGYFFMPYEYMTSGLVDDLWVIKVIS